MEQVTLINNRKMDIDIFQSVFTRIAVCLKAIMMDEKNALQDLKTLKTFCKKKDLRMINNRLMSIIDESGLLSKEGSFIDYSIELCDLILTDDEENVISSSILKF